MRCVETSRIAWMKPDYHDPNEPKPAREKIASDLAYELGLPVPPVLLHRAKGGVLSCLSLVCHDIRFELGDLYDSTKPDIGLPASIVECISKANSLADIVALDAWLYNWDRVNLRNTLVAIEHSGAELQFLDFGFAMRWKETNLTDFRSVSLPPVLSQMRNEAATRRMAERISDLPTEIVTSIVGRVPSDFLSDSARQLLLKGLLSRKEMLLPAFSAWYPS